MMYFHFSRNDNKGYDQETLNEDEVFSTDTDEQEDPKEYNEGKLYTYI